LQDGKLWPSFLQACSSRLYAEVQQLEHV